jgi:hypothetical protein
MLELRILNGAQALPLFDLPALLGRKRAAKEVGDQIETLIAFMDQLGGDPDLEDGNDREADDERDLSYPEWHTRSRKATRTGYEMSDTTGTDDDEDSDPKEEDDDDSCQAGDDEPRSGYSPPYRHIVLCGRAYHPRIGDDDDAEPLQCNLATDAEAGMYAANDA